MTINTPSREELELVAQGNPRVVRFLEQLAESAKRGEPFFRTEGLNGLSESSMGGIPEWAREIQVSVSGLSFPDASDLIVQLGYVNTSGLGVWYTSGYFSSASILDGATVATDSRSDGFHVRMGASGSTMQGLITLRRFDGNTTNYRWLGTHAVRAGTNRVAVGGGRILVNEKVSQVRVISSSGAAFDDGVVNFTFRR